MAGLGRMRRDLEHDPRGQLQPAAFDSPPARVTDEERARSRDLQRRYPHVTFSVAGGQHEGYVPLQRGGYTAIEPTRGEVVAKLEAFLRALEDP
jgi:hypothetical protein